MGEPEYQIVIEDDGEATTVDPHTGAISTELPDGGVVVQLNPQAGTAAEPGEFYANLASEINEYDLGRIAIEVVEAVEADDRSRQEWLNNVASGMKLLGLTLDQAAGDVGSSSAPVEGMSTVKSPLLLEACLRAWANAVGEMLPAAGPCKVKDDGPISGPPGQNDPLATAMPGMSRDQLATALERDMNHYLTTTASEYYPDTSNMLLWDVAFKGCGIKKVYRCPMRRRPVSESVPIKDFIVSDATKDLRSCARITHQIAMRPSVMKRMMRLGAYIEVDLTPPGRVENAVTNEIAIVQGVQPVDHRPEDEPYNLYETQCELDLPEFTPPQFKDSGIPLPYVVTIDKDSRQVLAIRRDWSEDDEECERKQLYVKYPYVPGPGFYGTGLLGILGNTSLAMTSALREALDAGMFASFPGFLYAKIAGRQLTNEFRVGPGQGVGIELPAGMKIGDAVMKLPYSDATPGLMTMIDKLTEQAQRLGNMAELPVGEGKQDAPVGTTLALLEQATKVEAAAHKGMHNAQADELQLLAEVFREYPDDFWKFNKRCATKWDADMLRMALDNEYLVPASDPNIPSQMHRIANAMGLVQLASSPQFGPLMDTEEVLLRVIRDGLRQNPNGLIKPPAASAPQADPAKLMEAEAKTKTANANLIKAQTGAQTAVADQVLKEKEIMGRLAISQNQEDTAKIIHQNDGIRAMAAARRDEVDQQASHVEKAMKVGLDVRKMNLEERKAGHTEALDIHNATRPEKPKGG